MSRPLRLILRSLVGFALVLGAAGAGCASFGQSAADSAGCVGLQCPDLMDGGGGDGSVVDVTPGEAAPDADANPAINALCGSGCPAGPPDDPSACAGYVPPDSGVGTAEAGQGGAAGANGDAAPGDAAGSAMDGGTQTLPPPRTGFGDASATPPPNGSSPDAGPGAPSPYGCYLGRHGDTAVAECRVAGSGTEHAPCVGSGDCASGFGCVLDGTAGECRRFCCEGNTTCDQSGDGTFCAERPLKDDSAPGGPGQMAPVCVPADNCNLAEAYPCAAANPDDCTCPVPGTACMVVGNGLTSCVEPPGTGKAGDACPCAWGHVCSQATGTCLKICSLTTSDSGCGNGKCQASKQMPEYFGVCVPSTAPDAGN